MYPRLLVMFAVVLMAGGCTSSSGKQSAPAAQERQAQTATPVCSDAVGTAKARPSVVYVQVERLTRASVGTGIIVDAEHVLTAAHVVSAGGTVKVAFDDDVLLYPAAVVDIDLERDLALNHLCTTLGLTAA